MTSDRRPRVVILTTEASLASLIPDIPHLWSLVASRVFAIVNAGRPVSVLQQTFQLEDEPAVREFIEHSPDLISLLVATAEQIALRFGDVRCRLGVLRDPEALAQSELTLLIPTTATADEAIGQLESLDEWWFEQDRDLTSQVIVDVSYLKSSR